MSAVDISDLNGILQIHLRRGGGDGDIYTHYFESVYNYKRP